MQEEKSRHGAAAAAPRPSGALHTASSPTPSAAASAATTATLADVKGPGPAVERGSTPSQSHKRRSFQSRRKERSCDSCKIRKTRCDARDDEPCSACLAAKLPCTFASPDHERRKMGPTRRIRELERTVEELTRRLQAAERRRKNSSQDDASQDERTGAMGSPLMSTTESYSDCTSTQLRSDDPGRDPHHRPRPTGSIAGCDTGLPSPGFSRRTYEGSSYESPPNEIADSAQMTWNPNMFGPGSAPQFIDTYKEYLQRNGMYAQHISGEAANMYEKAEQVPLLSDIVCNPGIDLRVFLPDRALANRLLEAFRLSIQNYKPMFYWPILERKFEIAWASPIIEDNSRNIREVFCIVMIVLAVGSQLVRVEESGPTYVSQERHGWKFFEVARRYLNLNNPVYTLEDATVLLLMSLYLDKATLPSPCWMICGAMARVCQDIGLHKQPPIGRFTNVVLECRSRLFWVAYVQDKRISMKMGRPYILRAEDCDIAYPGVIDNSGIGTALLRPHVGDVPVGELTDAAPEVINHRAVAQKALQSLKATIGVCKTVESILMHKLSTEQTTAQQIQGLQKLNHEIDEYWNQLPTEFTDPLSSEALEPAAIRVTFIPQHARMILFRYFIDPSLARTHSSELLNFCLYESIVVSLTTARLLYRAQLHPTFESQFGVVTDDIVHLHTFRVAVILLLGYELRGSGDTAVRIEDLEACVSTLQAVAEVHITGRRFLQLFKQFASLFNHPLGQIPIPKEDKVEISQPDWTWSQYPLDDPTGASGMPPPSATNLHSSVASDTELLPVDAARTMITDPQQQEQQQSTPTGPPFVGPEVLNRIMGGDWSSFGEILQWDRTFEAYLGNGTENMY